MKTIVRLLPLLLLFACVTPRISTPDERAIADEAITAVESGIAIYVAKRTFEGRYTLAEQARVDLATNQIAEIRRAIADSATVPVSLTSIMQRISALAVVWVVPAG